MQHASRQDGKAGKQDGVGGAVWNLRKNTPGAVSHTRRMNSCRLCVAAWIICQALLWHTAQKLNAAGSSTLCV